MNEKGICEKHGEFILTEGCPHCIAERRNDWTNPIWEEQSAHEQIVKVRYFSEVSQELSPREYTYYSADRLKVGEIVTVPVRDTIGKAKVSAVDVPKAEIASFKDKVKTIPTGSVVTDKTIEGMEREAEAREQVAMERLTGVGEEEPEPEELTPEEELEQAPFLKQIEKDIGAVEPVAETAIVLRPGEDIEAHGYFGEAMKFLEDAERRVITTVEDLKMATDDLSLISKLKTVMENKRKSLLEPLKFQSDAIRATYDYLMVPILQAGSLTREKMLSFDAEQKRIRREQEEINRQKAELAVREAALKGHAVEPIELVEVTPEAPKRVQTDMGTVGQSANWKWEVVDFALVPDGYKMINAGVLTPVVKASKGKITIPGIRIYNEPIIAVRTK